MGTIKKDCCGKHNNCADSTPASCIPVETDFPQWSELFGKECVSLEDVLSDLYKQVTVIREAIDLKELGDQCKSCIDYGVNNSSELTVNRVLKVFERKICQS